MALPNLDHHGRQDVARNLNAGDIGAHRVVVSDAANVRAKRFEHLGFPVRYPSRGDTEQDVFGVSLDRIEAPEDLDAPAANGLGPSRVVCSGFAWLQIIGPVAGTQNDWSHLHVALDGDLLGVVVGGANAGCARRLEPGDIKIGSAVYVEAGLALVRLSRPMPARSAG